MILAWDAALRGAQYNLYFQGRQELNWKGAGDALKYKPKTISKYAKNYGNKTIQALDAALRGAQDQFTLCQGR